MITKYQVDQVERKSKMPYTKSEAIKILTDRIKMLQDQLENEKVVALLGDPEVNKAHWRKEIKKAKAQIKQVQAT